MLPAELLPLARPVSERYLLEVLVKKRMQAKPSALDGRARDESVAPDEHLRQNEQHQQLYAALGKLKKEYRETLFLVYFEELSYRQAAQVLGRTEQQVTNLVYRGKQQLKQLLEQEGYQYEN